MITLRGIDPKMIANNLESSILIHPGEMIKDEIESRGMTQKKLAEMTGIAHRCSTRCSMVSALLPQNMPY